MAIFVLLKSEDYEVNGYQKVTLVDLSAERAAGIFYYFCLFIVATGCPSDRLLGASLRWATGSDDK